MSHLTYFRPDGVVGVGFEIVHSAKKMHSIAWPDRCAERMLDDELDRKQIRVEGQQEAPPKKPDTTLDEMISMPEPTDESQEDSVIPKGEDDDQLIGGDQSESLSELEDDDELADTELEDPASEDPVSEQQSKPVTEPEAEPVSEAQAIRDYLTANPGVANKDVVEALSEQGIEISSSQVTRQRKNLKEDGVI